MAMLKLIALILALVCFTLAGLNVSAPRVSLGWIGAAFLALALMLPIAV
jgi:hypothetical protein